MGVGFFVWNIFLPDLSNPGKYVNKII
jgi:hypothetical protein